MFKMTDECQCVVLLQQNWPLESANRREILAILCCLHCASLSFSLSGDNFKKLSVARNWIFLQLFASLGWLFSTNTSHLELPESIASHCKEIESNQLFPLVVCTKTMMFWAIQLLFSCCQIFFVLRIVSAKSLSNYLYRQHFSCPLNKPTNLCASLCA